ncbi:hypothetical protein A2872_01800 [Candidatus Gottesmanbacteria bacterium RIFCSPHIGHO2_01_FULL_42_12]|uniref:Uncharacterized protein n=1 Tax=Candidatus Gottesmanbacteria bacterium RIFCSPHIGHO2_01_FULL_42_12 TaxID=1798377 RepID=A0A1F5Z5U2_9BACT|nr:MAG: hypothetical protein A2872_01800 [Candidatus Gottesmanbacteria bacterium RIFCSPHIGHO2_01_FULL_42_12]
MGNLVNSIADAAGEFIEIAKKQIVGPSVRPSAGGPVPDERQQAAAAQKKLPGLTANDQRLAKVKISEIRAQLLQHAKNKAPVSGPEIKPKQKLPPPAVSSMYYKSRQTGESKVGSE